MLSLVLLPVALAREARLSTRLVEESAECSTSAKTQLSAWYTAAWQTRCRARTELFGPAPPFNEDAWLFAKTGGACELVIPSDNQRFEAPLAWTYSGGTVTPEKTEPTDNEFCEAGGEYGIVIEAAAITIALREVDDAATACKLSTDAAATSAAADSPLYGLAESIAGGVNLEFLVIIGGGHVAVTVTHTFQEIDADSPLHVGFAMSHVNREHLKQQVCAMASVSATNRRLIEAHNERYARGEETFAMTVPWRGAQDGTPPAARSMGHAAMPAGSMPADGRRLSAADILTTEQLATMPASWDYRKVHPTCNFRAQSQRSCGSCWAFATLGAFEKQICAVTNGNYKPQLSRQNLVDCNERAYACGGGNSFYSHPVMSEIGMATSTCLSYYSGCTNQPNGKPSNVCNTHDASNPSCSARFYAKKTLADSDLGATKISDDIVDTRYGSAKTSYGYYKTVLMQATETAVMASIYKYGSVVVSMDVFSNFMNYASGIYSGTSGSKQGGHAMHAIGWGVENGVKYWIIENSWGNAWGEGIDFTKCSESVCQGDFCSSRRRRRMVDEAKSATSYYTTSCGYMRVIRGTNVAGVETDASFTIYDPTRGPQSTNVRFTDHAETMDGPSSCNGVTGQVPSPTPAEGTRAPTQPRADGGTRAPMQPKSDTACTAAQASTAWKVSVNPTAGGSTGVERAWGVRLRVVKDVSYTLKWEAGTVLRKSTDAIEFYTRSSHATGGEFTKMTAVSLGSATKLASCDTTGTADVTFNSANLAAAKASADGMITLAAFKNGAHKQWFTEGGDTQLELVDDDDQVCGSCTGTAYHLTVKGSSGRRRRLGEQATMQATTITGEKQAVLVDLATSGEDVKHVKVGESLLLAWTAPCRKRYREAIVSVVQKGGVEQKRILAYLPISCEGSGTLIVTLSDADGGAHALQIARVDSTSGAITQEASTPILVAQAPGVGGGGNAETSGGEALACFPSDAVVQMSDGSTKSMSTLSIGDETATGRVTNWIHRTETIDSTNAFLRIVVEGGEELVVSRAHLIWINGAFDFAGVVRVGDALVRSDGEDASVVSVTDITTRDRKGSRSTASGLYAPLTASGELVVNGFKVSCYASVPCASHRLAQLLFAPMHAVSATGVANSISPIDFSWDAHVAASAAVAPIHWYPAMLRRISRAVLGNVCGDERAFVKAA